MNFSCRDFVADHTVNKRLEEYGNWVSKYKEMNALLF